VRTQGLILMLSPTVTFEPDNARWRYSLLAALPMAVLAMWPQFNLWVRAGRTWQGGFAQAHYDEEIYLAYVNGLVQGRPLRSDPLVEQIAERTVPESLFSIQFLPPLLLALASRLTSLSVSTLFICLLPLSAALSALALFYLVLALTNEVRVASGGAIFILCFGTLAAQNSAAIASVGYIFFPFLRRYNPALPFPLFFLFMLTVWRALTNSGRQSLIASIIAGLSFAALVFSYFYLWTASAAWLACAATVWLLAREANWKETIKRLAPMLAIIGAALAIYVYLLTQLSATTGHVHALELTRAPDLWRVSEIISLLLLPALLYLWRKQPSPGVRPLFLFTLSLLLLPFVLFNQQVITGRSLQPMHYQYIAANYTMLLSLLLIGWLSLRLAVPKMHHQLPRRVFPVLLTVMLLWAVVDAESGVKLHKWRNLRRNEVLPAVNRLRDVAGAERPQGQDRAVVFSPDIFTVSDNIAAHTPLAVLWANHLLVSPSLTAREQQERYFRFLYYSDVTPQALEQRLRSNDYSTVSSLFGYGRHTALMVQKLLPVTEKEIQDRVAQYQNFSAKFDRAQAARPELSWVVTVAQPALSLDNLWKWYEKESSEQVGEFMLCRVRLK
jgi:hypothetical protein